MDLDAEEHDTEPLGAASKAILEHTDELIGPRSVAVRSFFLEGRFAAVGA